jgi:hypothetical protein
MLRRWHVAASILGGAALALDAGCSSGAPSGTGGSASSSSSTTSSGAVTSSSSSSSSGTGGATSSSVATTSSSGGSSGTSGSAGTGGAPTYAPSGFSCSGAKPSLGSDVAPITAANCATAGCHAAMSTGPGVTDQLVGRIAEECNDLRLMVNPGDPEASYVIHKLTGKNLSACSPITTMPLGEAMLSAAHIQTIYDWICEGAPND